MPINRGAFFFATVCLLISIGIVVPLPSQASIAIEKEITLPFPTFTGERILQLSNGLIVVVGSGTEVWAVASDAEGHVMWQVPAFKDQGQPTRGFHSVVETSSKRVLFCGDSGHGIAVRATLVYSDLEGKEIGSRFIEPDQSLSDQPTYAKGCAAWGTGAVIAGDTGFRPHIHHWISRVDESGQPIWLKELPYGADEMYLGENDTLNVWDRTIGLYQVDASGNLKATVRIDAPDSRLLIPVDGIKTIRAAALTRERLVCGIANLNNIQGGFEITPLPTDLNAVFGMGFSTSDGGTVLFGAKIVGPYSHIVALWYALSVTSDGSMQEFLLPDTSEEINEFIHAAPSTPDRYVVLGYRVNTVNTTRTGPVIWLVKAKSSR